MFNKILGYLKQPSTLRGLALVLGIFGVSLSPEMWVEISATVGGIVGIIEIARNEKK